MKTKTKEVVIKSIDYKTIYGQSSDNNVYYVYEIETNQALDLNAIDSVITQTTNLPTSFTEFMEVNNLSQEQTLEILNNYKKQ
jgi:hypothetical protein